MKQATRFFGLCGLSEVERVEPSIQDVSEHIRYTKWCGKGVNKKCVSSWLCAVEL